MIRWCGQRPTTGYVLSSLRDENPRPRHPSRRILTRRRGDRGEDFGFLRSSQSHPITSSLRVMPQPYAARFRQSYEGQHEVPDRNASAAPVAFSISVKPHGCSEAESKPYAGCEAGSCAGPAGGALVGPVVDLTVSHGDPVFFSNW